MPFYNWECSACKTVWEIFQSMTEHKEDPLRFVQSVILSVKVKEL